MTRQFHATRLTRTPILAAVATLLTFAVNVGDQPVGTAQAAGDGAAETSDATPEQTAFVQQKILPLLQSRCFECHGAEADEPGGALRLVSREAMLAGGDSGAAVDPGNPDDSLLIQAVRYESFEMPPRTRLPQEEIELLVRWVRDGAPWPKHLSVAVPVSAAEPFPLEERRQAHWAWNPIRLPAVPAVKHAAWPKDDVDRFVLAQLEDAQLRPGPDADRRSLIRRLYFDLIGLPPKVEQVEAFVNDPADDDAAIAAVADQLLASPHFGERWGRHWLDLVRYAETLGHEFDFPLPHAWQYRDYIIRAFNADVPYDQLVREHIAGDLLPEPRRHPVDGFNESVIGTGFWFLGEDKHAPVDVKGEEAARIDNQLDVFSRTFLGLTVACARCHDHKFDAISTQDYYALSGFLQSSRRSTAWLDPHNHIALNRTRLQEIQREAAEVAANLLNRDVPAASLQTYATAALQVIGGAEVPAIADQQQIEPAVLQRWVDVLSRPETRETDHALSLLASIAQAGDRPVAEVVFAWRQSVVRTKAAASDETTLIADLSNGIRPGWFTVGPAFAGQTRQHSSVCWSPSGPRVSAGGVTSAELSPKLTGTLSSPTFELAAPEILVRVAGTGTRVRLIIDGYVMQDFSELLFRGTKHDINTEGEFRWIRLAHDVHRYQGRRAFLEFLDEGDGWFALQEVRFANRPGAAPPAGQPTDVNVHLAESLADNSTSADTVARLWAETVSQLPAGTATLFDADLLDAADDSRWLAEAAKWNEAADAVPHAVPVMAITEGTPENEHVFIRGNHRNLGDPVERRFLDAVSGTDQPPVQSGSGRLELCNRLLADANPFPARVAVNRVWQHLFGVGIVPSSDNFGVLGQPPTHPELLDHLAHDFRAGGWSFKSMIRTLVTSRTYRLSSQRSSAAEQADPTNRLLHRANIRRLEGETIRDAMLLLSGSLDPQLFGKSVPVYLTEFMQGRGRPASSGPLDGSGRRSIYISVNRNFLSPFMLAFDVPAPVTAISNRGTSNVPAQALILLNNEFVAQQAERWAARLLKQHPDMDCALQTAWQQLFARRADQATIDRLQTFMAAQATERGSSLDDAQSRHDALADVCHVLLNSKEFVFLN